MGLESIHFSFLLVGSGVLSWDIQPKILLCQFYSAFGLCFAARYPVR